MKFLTWQNPEQLFVAQVLIKNINYSVAELRIIMFYDKFKVDNSRFGAVLSEEMKNHHITGSHLVACADMRKENVFAI